MLVGLNNIAIVDFTVICSEKYPIFIFGSLMFRLYCYIS